MKLAPVLPLKKKSRTKQRVEGLIRLFQGKKGKKKAAESTSPPARSEHPGALSTKPPKPASSKTPSRIDAQAALMGDSQEASTLPAPKRKRRKPKKNPFLSTPVPDTFRPPPPLGPLPAVAAPPLPELPKVPRELGPLPSVHPPPAKKPTLSVVYATTSSDSEPKHHVPTARKFEKKLEGIPQKVAPPKTISTAPVTIPMRHEAPIAFPSPHGHQPRTQPQTQPRTQPRTQDARLGAFPFPRHETSTAPVRAIAVAHEKSNAVGTVELSCAARGLVLQFVRVSAYTEGYVPYPTTSSERITVPYEQVASVKVDGDGLVHLTVDPSCTPYSRLVLAGLARDPSFDHVASHRRRARIERKVTLAALVSWIPVALVLRALMPDLSTLIVMGIAASVGAVLHLVRRDVASKLVLFNRQTEQVRDELLGELRYRLAPGRVRTMWMPSEVPAPEASAAALGEPDGTEEGSLRGLFVTAGVVAAAAAVAILVGKNLFFSGPEDAARPWGHDQQEAWAFLDRDTAPASESLASSSAASISPDPTPIVPPPAPCTCERADSPLWADGIPKMSVLAHNRPGTTSYDRPSVYPEVAIVNNSSEDLKDIVMVVDFILGPRDGREARVIDKQDLFWEGRLTPGRAIRWRVRGRGDDFAVTSFISGMIGQDEVKSAPADAFYKLAMTANTPGVRLHGTKMLAYLGDERVNEGLEKLRQEGREEVTDTIDQISIAARPLRICSVRTEPDPSNQGRIQIKACVFNAGSSQIPRPMVTATAQLHHAFNHERWSLPEDIPSKAGIITTGTIAIPAGVEEADPSETVVRIVAER